VSALLMIGRVGPSSSTPVTPHLASTRSIHRHSRARVIGCATFARLPSDSE
jgi:hypothetical protein